MDLQQARILLRRRVNDEPGDRFADAELNDYLNQSLYNLQVDIHTFNDRAFYGVDTATLVEAEDLYDLPPTLAIYRVSWKGPSDTKHKKLTYRDFHVQQEATESSTSLKSWTQIGNKILLSWEPSAAEAAVSGGLKIQHAPLIALAEDTDVPTHLHLGLHLLWVVDAQLLVTGEGGDDADKAVEERKRLAARIPYYYQRNSHDQERFFIDTDFHSVE